ncbi:AAA family ATPase, partial [Kitasatospora sp. MBT63]
MRLHHLTVTAFGPFAGTEQVDFDRLADTGLFLLRGATGAGKSSVLDAVCFALYGEVPGARKGNPLRSDHAAPDRLTEVRLELTLGGRRLEITRSPEQRRPKRRGSGWTVEKPQTLLREAVADPGGGAPAWRALSKSHQEAGEEIRHLVGMSRDQFCQVVLLPQGDFARFLRA